MLVTLDAATPVVAQEAPAPAAEQRHYNVLFIIADDLNTRIGPYGSSVQTPNLDRLAASAVTFQRAYTQFPWCGPSRASFLTGTRPDTTGVIDLYTPFRRRLPDIVTLPQYFREHGYFSGRIGKIFHQGVPDQIGTSGPDDPQSWTEVVNPRGRDVDAQQAGQLVNMTPGIPFGSAQAYYADDGPENEQTDGMVATAAIEMLRANRDRPFFIGVGFYRPHVPEVAPQRYFDMYPVDQMQVADETPETLANVLDVAKSWTPDNFGMTDDEQRTMISAYSAATSYMDTQVGRVLDELDRLGLAENTIVVFTSDHGFLLGEHGQWMKTTLFEQATRVPLIIRAPGVSQAGQMSPRTVELLDLYPTLLDLAGLPVNTRNEGLSLSSLLSDPDDPRWHKPALSQIAGGRSVRTERYRYTEWQNGERGRELYEYASDPLEHHNLADDPRYAGVVELMRAMLPPAPAERRADPIHYSRERGCLMRPAGVPDNPQTRSIFCPVIDD
ncbi:MAG: sulfatase [Erythrobacter sp.]|nr:sulfatase [Erythrobacter sp.]